MNARSVSKSAARKLGITAIAILLLVIWWPAKAATVTITVTGKVSGGSDHLGIFGMGRAIPAGTPFTLAVTFDATKGSPIPSGQCPNSLTGIAGARENSPATAALTINGKSYVFEHSPDARSSTWRRIVSVCSKSEIGINITEGQREFQGGVNIKITPAQGESSLTQDGDWKSPVSLPNVEWLNRDNLFGISRPGSYIGGTQSYLQIESVTVSGSRKIGPGMFSGR